MRNKKAYSILSRYIPGVGFLDHMVALFLALSKNLCTDVHSGSCNLQSHQQCMKAPFSPLSAAFIVCRVFDDGRSDWCEVIPQCSGQPHLQQPGVEAT